MGIFAIYRMDKDSTTETFENMSAVNFKFKIVCLKPVYGPSYKLDVTFDNGVRELLSRGMGCAMQKSINVSINYTFKKED